LNSNKIKSELNWKTNTNFEDGILKTLKWYLANKNYYKNLNKRDIIKRLGKND